MAAKLKKAKADLAAAKAAVVRGQAALDAQHATAGQMIRDQYQQQTNLLPIAALMGTQSTEELQTRLQWSTTMFDTAQATLDRLTVIQGSARCGQGETGRTGSPGRRRSPRSRREPQGQEGPRGPRRRPESRCRSAARAASAHRARGGEGRGQGQGPLRQADPRTRLGGAPHRRPDRQGQGRGRPPAGRSSTPPPRRQAAARRAHKSSGGSNHSSRPARRKSSNSGGSNAGHGFSYPVSAPITSPYGMRFHPVLHYWKLHDGTDFGAGLRHRDPGPVLRPGRRALLQRRLRQPADDRPRLHRRQLRHHRLQPRHPLHRAASVSTSARAR